jgi:hypothetical protein
MNKKRANCIESRIDHVTVILNEQCKFVRWSTCASPAKYHVEFRANILLIDPKDPDSYDDFCELQGVT